MKIEEGKFYRTYGGEKIGPMERVDYNSFKQKGGGQRVWMEEGGNRWACFADHKDTIVAEWVDEPLRSGPVRIVTRHEIVPGTYGRLLVEGVSELWGGSIPMTLIAVAGDGPDGGWRAYLTASELRATAATLIELADALDAMRGTND